MKIKIVCLFIFIAFLNLSCTNDGVQGTSLYSSFQGLNEIQVLSPTAILLKWHLDPSYSEYRIYQNDSVSPVKTETFSSTVISSLNSNTSYSFYVSGYSSINGEKFFNSKVSTKTLEKFVGLTSAGVTKSSSSSVKLTWTLNSDKATYKIYHKESTGNWSFNSASGLVTGANEYNISNLTPGKTYCFYVVAEYLDNTSEPSVSDLNQINSSAPCQVLTSDMASLPTVKVNSVILGQFPWFWASGGDPNYKIEIFELDTGTRVASKIGNGTFRAFTPSEGSKNYYAQVTSGTNLAQVSVELDYGSGAKPSTAQIRTLASTGDYGPVYPPVLAGGRGQQNLGYKIINGDFNCDGHADVATSTPTATPFITDQHYNQMGAVIIYYNWQPPPYIDQSGNVVVPPMELKITPTPSPNAVYPDPLLITYPVTASGNQMGTGLAVGNFNGDCYYRDDTSPQSGSCNNLFFNIASASEIKKIKSCDDLVITSKGGYFYTIFSDPINGLVAGSLSNTAGVDELTCDSVSNTCRTAKYNQPTGYSMGTVVTSGDYNNDGFDDLALSASFSGLNHVLVYRGSSQGLYPYGHSKSHSSIDPTSIPIGNTMGVAIGSLDSFAFSLGTAHNSRTCVNNSPVGYIYRSPEPPRRKGYDFTKCDELIIGSPGRSSSRGSIFSCKANLNYPSTDIPQITSWSCQEHFPDNTTLASGSPNITVRGYGYSILGVPNQNGHPLSGNVGANVPANALPDISGALFVGAPTSSIDGSGNAGAVFGYYMTPKSSSFTLGGIQGILGNSPSGHSVSALNTVPCNNLNANITTGSLRHCENQAIFSSPATTSAQFGYSLASIPDKVQDQDPWMPMLAVSAPYRNTLDSNGNSVSGTGTIYLYRGDISTFGIDNSSQVTAPRFYYDNALNSSCTVNCTWYSGGISPFGPTVIYPLGLNSNANFGIGGAAGGSFNGDNFADLISSAPGSNNPSSSNGELFAFYSNQGSFSPSVNLANLNINTNISLEGNYRFEDAKVIGDLNGDGYDDVVSHMNNNGKWVLVVFYGSASGLIQTPAPTTGSSGNQPLLVSSLQDSGLGKEFFRIGDVNGDGYDDIFAIGTSASYIYYGSSSGLVSSIEPDIAPIGKSPLKFGLYGANALVFYNSSYYETFGYDLNVNTFYRNPVQSVVYGDYNADGYSDFAIRMYNSSVNPPASIVPPGLTIDTLNKGRVIVLYGSSIGPETNRTTGVIQYKNGALPADVVVENPCGPTQTPTCKVQVIASSDVGVAFGFGLATRKGLNSATSDSFDGLIISDPRYNTDTGIAYVYQGSNRGLKPISIQKLIPRDTAGYFGYSIVEPNDINKDGYQDLTITSGGVSKASISVFYGSKIGGQNAYYGATSLTATDYWGAPAIIDNATHASPLAPRPQVLIPPTYVSSNDYLGQGLAALGDFNRDGYSDFIVNVPNGDYSLSGTILQTGYAIIYFGGFSGIQSQGTVVTPYPRCYGGTTPICEPYQVFLPNHIAYEYTTISQDSVGDINGDGLPDVIIGGVGRNHPSGQAISSGVIYVMY